MIAPCRLLVVLSVCASLCSVSSGVPATQAQPPSLGTNLAHVRFWKTNLHNLPAVRVVARSVSRHPATTDLGSSGPGFAFNSYVGVPPGPAAFDVFDGAGKKPLRTLQAELAPDEFFTVLLGEPDKKNGLPAFELIDDGPAATPGDSAQLRVRFFVGGLKEAKVSMGENLNVEFVSEDGYLRVRGIKPVASSIHTVGTGAGGKSFEWNNEADFKQHHRQTLLIYPDPYGRVRPRLIEDGELSAAPADENEQR